MNTEYWEWSISQKLDKDLIEMNEYNEKKVGRDNKK